MSDTKTERDYSRRCFCPRPIFPCAPACPRRSRKSSSPLGEEDLYKKLREQSPGPPALRAARWPALCQRQHPYRPRAQQDPERHGHPLVPDARATIPTTCPAGTATACRSNGRSRRSTAPRARTRTRCRSTSSAGNAAQFADALDRRAAEEFKRLGVEGDFENPYTTMSFDAEATHRRRADEVRHVGQLYRGSKPVMWSVVERTALAEAEVEYHDYESDTIWVKFPVVPT
jgi:isoleucyl-tRNA synthetase